VKLGLHRGEGQGDREIGTSGHRGHLKGKDLGLPTCKKEAKLTRKKSRNWVKFTGARKEQAVGRKTQ